MKRFFVTFFSSIVIVVLMLGAYIYLPSYFETFDNKIRDTYFVVRGEKPASEDVVIVDIDEKSLAELGQWPWERVKIAQVLQNLTEAGVGIIGFDIVFAEADNSSPKKVADFIGLDIEKVPEMNIDYDEILSESVANTPTILGYIFDVAKTNANDEDIFINLPAIYIEKNLMQDTMIKPHRAILNVDVLQDSSYSTGYFNAQPDGDGVVRSVPLLMKFNDDIYPALSFEMVRILLDEPKVIINHNEIGIESIEMGKKTIPVDRYSRLLINYKGPGKSYKYLSMSDIYNKTFDPKDVEGKFVLIGTSAQGLLDLRTTPFDSVYPGVEVHATAIDNILNGDFISRPDWAEEVDMFSIIGIGLTLAILLSIASPIWMFIIASISVAGIVGTNYYMFTQEGYIINIIFPILTAIAIIFISNIISYFLESKQKEMIKGKFASKVSPAVMEDLIKSGNTNVFEGNERDVSIFFSDVRGFTNISEAMKEGAKTPGEGAKNLINFLNEYMDPMTEIIISEEGTIDKFIGDAIMAYWNAPNDVKNHPDKALSAAIRQIDGLIPLNKKLIAEKKPLIDIGIGLNTGPVVVGEMGSQGRSDYTIIGDAVNLGARLESLCKSYGARIIISEYMKELLTKEYIIRDLDLVKVKGKSEPVEIFEVYGFGKAEGRLKEELDSFNRAVHLYRTSNFAEALEIFKDINSWEDKANKKIYDTYIFRCEHYIQEPPVDFDGVWTHTTKG